MQTRAKFHHQFDFTSVSYEFQNLFSTFGVVGKDFLFRRYLKQPHKFAVRCKLSRTSAGFLLNLSSICMKAGWG